MLAIRFRRSYSTNKMRSAATSTPPVPLWSMWILSLLLAIPTLLISFSGASVTTVGPDNDTSDQQCSFDHVSNVGIALDIITFQTPLVLTIAGNIYLYSRGIYSLKNTPYSVRCRQLKRAGGYVIVLLVVWIPNLLYNALCIMSGSNTKYTELQDLVVILGSAQVRH